VLRKQVKHCRRADRRGIAAIESILCLPVIFLMAIATVELCSAIFLRETLVIAAYEGARVGIKRGATAEEATAMATSVLQARGIQGGDVTVEPSDFGSLDALDPVRVIVSAPVNNNSAFITRWFMDRTLEASVVMVREFDD
jgi:Flp pilus assembly protein TadG